MQIKFLQVEYDLESKCYNYDKAKYLCSIRRDDYTEFIKSLKLLQLDKNRNFGSVEIEEKTYEVVDVTLSVPTDSDYYEHINVYVMEA